MTNSMSASPSTAIRCLVRSIQLISQWTESRPSDTTPANDAPVTTTIQQTTKRSNLELSLYIHTGDCATANTHDRLSSLLLTTVSSPMSGFTTRITRITGIISRPL